MMAAGFDVIVREATGDAYLQPGHAGAAASSPVGRPEQWRFGLLGPVVLRAGDALVPVRAPMMRSLLAGLLLSGNRVASLESLIDILWGDEPPVSAVASLQNHVMRLRRRLGDQDGSIIRAVAPGYLMEVPDGELDVEVFTRLVNRASQAGTAGDWEAAVAELTAALTLWRGDPLADVTSSSLLGAVATRLSQQRLDAQEGLVDGYLELARYSEAISELTVLTAAHPLRERFHAQFMIACSRAGRTGEALAVYQRARRVLAEELGVEPGPALQELQQRILAADPEVAADPGLSTRRLPGSTRHSAFATEQLPPDTVDFTGRERQLKLLHETLGVPPDGSSPGAVAISAIAGMGGIGKTALAVHAAHRLRGRFPDGQLFASLQGTSSPLCPAEILARFLRDLGIPDPAIPVDEDGRASLYRSMLADRNMLVVLDDARDAAQVRPLLPGTARCAVIVTSRSTLPGLTGAILMELDVLDEDEARELFGAIVGPCRAASEPKATAAVLGSCAGLPLAIRVAAARLAWRPGWSIGHLSAKLAKQRARLAELRVGDLAVRASFAVSYDALPAGGTEPARLFRLLGLLESAEHSLAAIAALADQPVTDAEGALEALCDAYLVQSPAPGRYRLHDLLRSYAAELAEFVDTSCDRDAAIRRMLGWYAGQAVAAAQALEPARTFPVLLPATAVAATTPASPAQALDWLEAELPGLVAATLQASDLGSDAVAAQIAVATWDFFQRTSHRYEWLAVSQAGVRSARHLGDPAVLGLLLTYLGQVYIETGRFKDASESLSEALAIRRRSGDRLGEAKVLNTLAIGMARQGRNDEALGFLRSALAIFADVGDPKSVGLLMNNIGQTLLSLKRHDEALAHLDRALAIQQEIGDQFWRSITEGTLGDVYLDLGQFEDAVSHYRRALADHEGTAREHADQANVLCSLGAALEAMGRVSEARQTWRAAIPILQRNNDPRAADLRARLACPAIAAEAGVQAGSAAAGVEP